MPTRRAMLILVLTAALFVLGAVRRLALNVGLVVDGALLTLFALDRRRLPALRQVRAAREHQRVFSLGEPNLVEIVLTNDSPHPLRGNLQDNPPEQFKRDPESLAVEAPPHSRVRLHYGVTAFERGPFSFSPAVLRAHGPLGLACRYYRFPATGGEEGRPDFTVYPSLGSATPRQVAALARQAETGYHRLRRQVEGTSPSQIRPWAAGDSYRHVNWKATARYDRPMVTQYDADRNQVIYVFLDCGRLMRTAVGPLRKLDFAVNACADLARVAASRGDLVGLCCFAGAVTVWHDPKGRRDHLRTLLASLALVKAENKATNYRAPVNMFLARAKRRALCLFLTTFSESESTWELMRRLQALRPRHVPAVVSLRDPAVEEAFHRPALDFQQACRKLAAADLREELDLFAHSLRQRRAHFVEVRADALSLAAVQTYLNVKARGLL